MGIDFGGGTTGLNPIQVVDVQHDADNNSSSEYNLAGQRVGRDYRGLIIKNGTKTIKR